MALLTVAEIDMLVRETLERCNTSADNAASVAAALTGAELAGQAGHGLRRVPSYASQALSGKLDGHAVPKLDKRAAATLSIDAAHGFAYPALDLAVETLPAMARACGIALAGIHRSHHCGVAGLTVERFAEAGLVAMLFANTPAAMAPWGGTTALFGTNPIAFAAPTGDGETDPIVIDISLSKVARGKIMAAKQKGQPIPEGWALDADGSPTTDADSALAGTMVPMGDAKGTALALMVELLAASLIGANTADKASSFFEAEGPAPGVGQTLIVIDPGAIGGPDAIVRMGAMAQAISDQAGARVPGHRRARLREQLRADGVEIDDALLAEIGHLGR
ncbi:MAG: Ldh family oxidoreductase [Pseudomonadota bacterium]